MSASWVKEVQQNLRQARQYFKTDYKLHVTITDQCPDHCRTYALSDPKAEFQTKCSHDHSITCDRCEMIEETLSMITTTVSTNKVQLK